MQTVEPLLGTRAEVHVAAGSVAVAAQAEDRILAEVRRLEQVFTVFDPWSDLNRLRRDGQTSVPELIEVCDLAVDWKARSAGAFDPHMQSLSELWGHAEVVGVAPSPTALAQAMEVRSNGHENFDNLNAIAKGWIAQAALRAAHVGGATVEAAWLSLGGDVVHSGTGSITIGIEDPHRPYDNVGPLAAIEISNEAVATSGGARRWWTIGGQRYSKILDPRTGMPADRVAAATVVASDAATADVLATIATVEDAAQTLALCASVGADCLLIHHDRSRTVSCGRFDFA